MNTALRWLERARDALDERGRAAWIAVMVISFVLFWPIGLALLAYILWSKRMGCHSWGRHRRFTAAPPSEWPGPDRQHRLRQLPRGDAEAAGGGARRLPRFLDHLRAAKDRAEFDQFMTSRQAPDAA